MADTKNSSTLKAGKFVTQLFPSLIPVVAATLSVSLFSSFSLAASTPTNECQVIVEETAGKTVEIKPIESVKPNVQGHAQVLEGDAALKGIKRALASLVKDPVVDALVKENPDVLFYAAVNFISGDPSPELKAFADALLVHSHDFYANGSLVKRSDQASTDYKIKVDAALNSAWNKAFAASDNSKKMVQWQTMKLTEEMTTYQLAKEIDPANYYKSAKGKVQAKNLANIGKSIGEIKAMVAFEMRPAIMDFALMGLDGFLRHPEIKDYQARPWENPAQMNAVSIADIKIDLREFLKMASLGLEVEAPFIDTSNGYAWETATYLERALPSLSKFVGKTSDEVEANKSCTRSWCNEERRHPMLWLNVIGRLTGRKVSLDDFKGNKVSPIHLTEAGIKAHLLDRLTSEIGASAPYLVTANQAQGPTRGVITNMYRDELKHLSIFATSAQYLLGYRPMFRRQEIAKTLLGYMKIHQAERSSGADLTASVAMNIQLLSSILMVEETIQSYVGSVPLRTMRRLFESEYLRDPDPTVKNAQGLAELHLDQAKEKIRRLVLAPWTKGQRSYYLTKEILETTQADTLNGLIVERGLSRLISTDLEKGQTLKSMKRSIDEAITESDVSRFAQVSYANLYGRIAVIAREIVDAHVQVAIETAKLSGSTINEQAERKIANIETDRFVKSILVGLPKVAPVNTAMVRDAVYGLIRDTQIMTNPYHLETMSKSSHMASNKP
jgi:hypothetical protein